MTDAYLKTLYPSQDWYPLEGCRDRWWLWSRDRRAVRLYVLGGLESGAGVFEFIVEHVLSPEQLESLQVDIGGCACRPQEVPLPPEFDGRRFFRCAFDAPSLACQDMIEVRLRVHPRLRPCDLDHANADARTMGLAISNAWVRSRHLPLGPAGDYLDRRKVAYLETGEAPCDPVRPAEARNRARLATLKDAHAGGRCCIIVNGAGLTVSDLERLRNEVTFAADAICLAFDRTDWRPTYYTVADMGTARCLGNNIAAHDLTRIFNRRVASLFPEDADIVWYDADPAACAHGSAASAGFSDDLLHGAWPGDVTAFEQLQLACHMGFREIYFLGAEAAVVGAPAQGGDLDHAGAAAAWRMARRCCEAAGRIVRDASRSGGFHVFERVDPDAVFPPAAIASQPLPLVSVVMPARDAAATIAEALASVRAQAGVRVEVLLVDDGCRDDTVRRARRVIDEGSLVVLTHAGGGSQGVCASRDLAMRHATGDYIAFLDADDAFAADKLATQVRVLREHPECILCHTDVKVMQEGDVAFPDDYFHRGKNRKKYFLHDEKDFLENNRICTSSVMVRSDARRVYKILPLKYQFEDWLHWLLLASRGLFMYLPEKLVCYRSHENSFTYSASVLDCCFARIEILAALLQSDGHAFDEQWIQDALKDAIHTLGYLQTQEMAKE
jgi:hypothetical protein